MQPVSGRWDSALRVAHDLVVTCEVWTAGVRQTLPDGTTSLRVVSGQVTVDEGSKVRRTATIVIANPELLPIAPGDLLTPPFVDLRVFSGVRYAEGDVEMVPVGVFRLSSASLPAWLSGIQLAGDDYSRVLVDARFLGPWATPAGNKVTAEIARMATAVLPSLTVVDFTGSAAKTAASSWDRDRWDSMDKLAASIGAEVFFDPVGRLIIRPVPQVTSTSQSVWTVDGATPTAVMTDVSTSLSVDRVYNAVVASSSAQGVVASAVAYQRSGPFAWSSSFQRPRFYSSPVLTTVNQCASAATAILARSVAFTRQITVQSVPNPALEVGDVVTVTLPPDVNGRVVSEPRIVSRITLPLAPAAMGVDTRVGVDALTTSDVGSLS